MITEEASKADFRWSTIEIDPVWGCGQDVAESPSLSTRLVVIVIVRFGGAADVVSSSCASVFLPPPFWAHHNSVTIISRSSLIASDLIVIVVTWLATYKTTRLARVAGHKSRMTLSVLLLRDGMIYFM